MRNIAIAQLSALAMAYPITYTSCGVQHVINSKPTRIVTMNQGATEFLGAMVICFLCLLLFLRTHRTASQRRFLLGLGLADHMAGTAYLDDAIWPRYASAYASIPVLSSSYPNESTLLDANPDFIVASYQSAFRQTYVHSSGSTRGIFSNATIAPCEGSGSEFGTALPTCRPQLHAQGIGTFLFADACEDRSLRPALLSEDTVYQEDFPWFSIHLGPYIGHLNHFKSTKLHLLAIESSLFLPGLPAVWG